MSHIEQHCCDEYNALSRRGFIGGVGKAALLAALGPAWLPKVVYAQHRDSARDILVHVYLRGGADGLTLCVPWGDPDYYVHRPFLAVPRPDSGQANRAIDLDGFFGFPQAMSGLMNAYTSGQLLIVHATGSHDPTRSHFDAQRYMEVGKPADPNIGTGWVGRHLSTTSTMQGKVPLRGLGIGYGLAKTMTGGPQTLPFPNLTNPNLTGNSATRTARGAWLDSVYGQTTEPLRSAAIDTQRTIQLLNKINVAGYVPSGGAVYPTSAFGTAIRSAAALVKANVGVEAIHIDHTGGWDTHNTQGVFDGLMYNLMRDLSNGLGAFHTDMYASSFIRNVTVVMLTEFGRVVRENGSSGTDHGHGLAMMVMGGSVNGGRVLTNWPGLAPGQLYQNRDLAITIDWRDIVAEVVYKRLQNRSLSTVFPNYTPTFRGVCNQ